MSNIKPYNSTAIDSILSEIDPKLEKRIEFRMKLAAKIDNARLKMGLSKKQLAQRFSKSPSEISKWLSGTHNFTTDTLFDIQQFLAVELINTEEDKPKEQILQFSIEVTQEELSRTLKYGYPGLNDFSDLLFKTSAFDISMSGLHNFKIEAEA